MIDGDPRTGAAGWIGDPVLLAPDNPENVGPGRLDQTGQLDRHEFARGRGLAVPIGALPGAATVPESDDQVLRAGRLRKPGDAHWRCCRSES